MLKSHFIDWVKLLFLVLLLTSCSSIPLTSMMKLASIDTQDLLSINPSEVRTRITLNEPAELDTREVNLVLKFNYKNEKKSQYQFALNLLDSRVLKDSSDWFSRSVKKYQYDFAIAPTSVEEFKKYQREFYKYGKPNQYYWTVYYYLKKQPEKGTPIDLSLELKLSQNDDYFYLFKSAELEVN